MIPHFTPEQIETMSVDFSALRFVDVPYESQCINLGAKECVGWALPHGWCRGCWALIDPGTAKRV